MFSVSFREKYTNRCDRTYMYTYYFVRWCWVGMGTYEFGLKKREPLDKIGAPVYAILSGDSIADYWLRVGQWLGHCVLPVSER